MRTLLPCDFGAAKSHKLLLNPTSATSVPYSDQDKLPGMAQVRAQLWTSTYQLQQRTHPLATFLLCCFAMAGCGFPRPRVQSAVQQQPHHALRRLCHAQIWATGERWHYAPMATRLAQAGVLTLVMSYTLYPQALAAEQAAEVGQALTWSLNNAAKLGGDPNKVQGRAHDVSHHATSQCGCSSCAEHSWGCRSRYSVTLPARTYAK